MQTLTPNSDPGAGLIPHTGSRSFAAVSRLLPKALREPTAALYAFCRAADDAVEFDGDPAAALTDLRQRLDLIYRGVPRRNPLDRTFAETVRQFSIPRALPEALLEGCAWDSTRRRYETIDDLMAYCGRVASTVGLMMTLLMEQRDPIVLARAADLGVAMQLTNIARDVGEDAQRGRLYLPQSWLRAAGIAPDAFVQLPRFSPRLAGVVRQVLDTADMLYRRAESGIGALPRSCRTAIMAARLIYADIGRVIAERGYDSVTSRAAVPASRKLKLILMASAATKRLPAPGGAPSIAFCNEIISAIDGAPSRRSPAPEQARSSEYAPYSG